MERNTIYRMASYWNGAEEHYIKSNDQIKQLHFRLLKSVTLKADHSYKLKSVNGNKYELKSRIAICKSNQLPFKQSSIIQ